MTIRIFLADDHPIVRDGLKVLLGSQAGIEVTGEAGGGRELLAGMDEGCPDLVVMDIAMPGLNGIETTKQLLDKCPRTRVIILSVYSTAEHIYRALRAGADGYVLKESAGREIVQAVRAVHCKRRFLSARIIELHPGILDDLERDFSPLERLSGREKEVLQMVAEGKSSAMIADMLFLSPKTVETYRSRLMSKLGVKDIPSLVKFAVRHGITSL